MRSRLLCVVYLLGLCAAGAPAVSAAQDEPLPLPGLDECLKAALEQRPGAVVEWRQLGSDADPSYKVAVISPEGKIAETTCSPAAPQGLHFENRLGLRRYEIYERITVPESVARTTAPIVFRGPVRMTGMALDLNLLGHVSYEYYMLLPSGHKAASQVDGIHGSLTHAEADE